VGVEPPEDYTSDCYKQRLFFEAGLLLAFVVTFAIILAAVLRRIPTASDGRLGSGVGLRVRRRRWCRRRLCRWGRRRFRMRSWRLGWGDGFVGQLLRSQALESVHLRLLRGSIKLSLKLRVSHGGSAKLLVRHLGRVIRNRVRHGILGTA
jgi:hypothetical protein